MAEPAWVELRVHGVSGTPPESMLDCARVVQVAGDELGRTFRRATPEGAPVEEADRIVEAYHWGALTSGSWVKGLWLLLAPFGLVNAAQFTLLRPTGRLSRGAHAVAGAGLRLVGLALTLLFVLAAAVIAVDLWAWQSARASSVLSYLLGFLAPLGLLLLYSALARPKADPDLQPPPMGPADSATTTGADGHHPSELVRPAFFEADPDAPALRRLHVAGGGLLVAILMVCPQALNGVAFGTTVYWVGVGLLAVVVLGVLLLVDPSARQRWDRPDRRTPSTRTRFARGAAALLVGCAAVAVLVAAVALGAAGAPDPAVRYSDELSTHYPGIDWASYLIMGMALVGLVVLLLANAVLAVAERGAQVRRNRRFAPYLAGTAASGLAAISLFLGVGYTGAFATAAAAALRTVRPERPDLPSDVLVPELLSRVVYAWGLTVFAILVLGVVVWFRRRARLPGLVDQVERDVVRGRGTPEEEHLVPRRWVARIAGARWVGRLKNSIPLAVVFFAVLGLVLSGAVIVEVLTIVSNPPGAWPRLGTVPTDGAAWLSASEWWPQRQSTWRSLVLTVGTFALSTLGAALLALGRSALLGDSARRGANVIWDVISFWPRAAHPFVPATYAQRAVVDIADRVRWHRGQGRRVVVCAHSQGSLLTFAALLRLCPERPGPERPGPERPGPERPGRERPDALAGVGLLTFGSQLQVMFSRGFSSYVNLAAIERLHRDLGGAWRNLYRDTDPLAGPVLSWAHRTDPSWVPDGPGGAPTRRTAREEFGPDWRLYDPPMLPAWPSMSDRSERPDLDERSLLPLRGHTGYWLDPAWDPALEAICAELRDAD